MIFEDQDVFSASVQKIFCIEMSVLEKAGCIVTRFMLFCSADLFKNMPSIFKHIGGEVVADPEIPQEDFFFSSMLTLI